MIDPTAVTAARPDLPDKAAYREWCNSPSTQHVFISGVIGRSPTIRVHNEYNPPTHMCGIVLDYDAVPPADIAGAIIHNAPSDLRPMYYARTFSGHVRLYYFFEETVPVFTAEVAKRFLTKCVRVMKFKRLLPGFEQEALFDLTKYYELGQNWMPVPGGTAIPRNLLHAWLAEASRDSKWEQGDVAIPIESIRTACEQRWPDRWPNGWATFDVGSRGPRFWDDSASDPTAVIVRENGCQYFSEGGGFMSWAQILGVEFVQRWSEDRRGNAIRDIYFDGRQYWVQLPSGVWQPKVRNDIALYLRCEKGLSNRAGRNSAPSEVEYAIHAVQSTKHVSAAMPFLYRPVGPTWFNGKQYLNISTVQPIQPAAGMPDWGEGFPMLGQLLYTMFDPVDQIDWFVAWLKHVYVGALTGELTRGLALFIAGPAGLGKSMVAKAVIGKLLGRFEDAGKFLVSGDQYNDKLFEAPLWTVNDEIVPTNPNQRSIFSQIIKKVVADDSFVYRPMYSSGGALPWVGRIIVTMNNDPESLRMLPETEINIMDKILLMKTKQPEVDYYPSDAEIERELPHLGAFLRDWTIPDHCLPPANRRRFGIAPYHHPELVEAAASVSHTSSFEDLLQLWRTDYFENDRTNLYWEGTSTRLLQFMVLNEGIRPIVEKNFGNPTTIGMHLNKLINRGSTYLSGNPGTRIYRIQRP